MDYPGLICRPDTFLRDFLKKGLQINASLLISPASVAGNFGVGFPSSKTN